MLKKGSYLAYGLMLMTCIMLFCAPAFAFAAEQDSAPADTTDTPAENTVVLATPTGEMVVSKTSAEANPVGDPDSAQPSAPDSTTDTNVSNVADAENPQATADNEPTAGDEDPISTSATNTCTVNYTISFDVTGSPESYYDSNSRHGYVVSTFSNTSGTWSDGTNGIRTFTGTTTVQNHGMAHAYAPTDTSFPVTTYSTDDVVNPQYTIREWAIASWSCDQYNVSNTNDLYYSETVFFYTPGSSMKAPSSWLGTSSNFYVYSRTASNAEALWNMYASEQGGKLEPPADYVEWADSQSAQGGTGFYSWARVGLSIYERDSVNLVINLVPVWSPVVTFDFNGGEGTLLDKSGYTMSYNTMAQINKAMKITTPQATLTRDGLVQTGWNTKADGGGTHYDALEEMQSFTNLTLFAEWSADASYTLAYGMGFAEEGTLPESATGPNVVTEMNTLVRDGYKANGWNTKKDGSGTHYSDLESISLTSNLVLFPDWIKTTYTIAFNPHGGSGMMDNLSMTFGTPKALPKNTYTREGYDFAGWSPSANATVAIYADEQVVNNLTSSGSAYLYAIWRPSTFSLSYDTDGGAGAYQDLTGLTPSSVIDLPTALPSKPGQLFDGWYFDRPETEETLRATPGITAGEVAGLSGKGNYTLTAHWAEIPFTITYNLNGATGGIVPAKLAIAGSGQRTVAANTLTRAGGTAAGWNTAADGSGTYYAGGEVLELGSDLTLYAQFRDSSGTLLSVASATDPNKVGYTVSYNLNGGSGTLVDDGAITSDGLTAVLASNTLSRAGYMANGWNTKADGSGTAYANGDMVSLAGDLVLYAVWNNTEDQQSGAGDGDKEPAASDQESGNTNPGNTNPNVTNDPVNTNGNGSPSQQASTNGSGSPSQPSVAPQSSSVAPSAAVQAAVFGISPATAAFVNSLYSPAQTTAESAAGTRGEAQAAQQASMSTDALIGLGAGALSWLTSAATPEKAYADSGSMPEPAATGNATSASKAGFDALPILAGGLAVIALIILGLLAFKREKDQSEA